MEVGEIVKVVYMGEEIKAEVCENEFIKEKYLNSDKFGIIPIDLIDRIL